MNINKYNFILLNEMYIRKTKAKIFILGRVDVWTIKKENKNSLKIKELRRFIQKQ